VKWVMGISSIFSFWWNRLFTMMMTMSANRRAAITAAMMISPIFVGSVSVLCTVYIDDNPVLAVEVLSVKPTVLVLVLVLVLVVIVVEVVLVEVVMEVESVIAGAGEMVKSGVPRSIFPCCTSISYVPAVGLVNEITNVPLSAFVTVKSKKLGTNTTVMPLVDAEIIFPNGS